MFKIQPLPDDNGGNGGGGTPDPNPPKESWFSKHLFQIGIVVIIVVTLAILVIFT